MKILAKNKKAKFNYFLSNPIEVGIVLKGKEVKDIIDRGIDLTSSYVDINENDVYLLNAKINTTNEQNNTSTNKLKLLLHKKEIKKLAKLSSVSGYTLLCTNIYIADNGKIKGTVELGKGKHTYDKRETIKKRDLERKGNQ